MSMTRVTTPTHTFRLPEDVDSYDKVEITYVQSGVKIEKLYEGEEVDWASVSGRVIAVTLTQVETKKFSAGKVDVHIRVKTSSGKVLPSKHFIVDIENTNSEVIL
jgi:hypothetical protein